MTMADLAEKYGMSEAELYVYAFNHLKSFRNQEQQTGAFPALTLHQLDHLLMSEAQKKDDLSLKDNDEWAHDPTEDEPDDREVAPPMIEPEQVKEERNIEDAPKRLNDEEPPHATTESWETWGKSEMIARMEAMKQELEALRQNHLDAQSSAAEKQAELLAKAIHEKQLAESKIATIKEDAASVKHLSNIRIKELEERNDTLEKQLKDTHEELNNSIEELIKAQHMIQETKDSANKKGAQQALQLLDAEHRQNELYKAIHEKEIALTEEKEKTQDLLEKYNAALLRIGEIVSKIEKARTRIREIGAEFDVYVNADIIAEAEETDSEPTTIAMVEAGKTETYQMETPIQPLSQSPNPKTLNVLGKPLHEIYPDRTPQEKTHTTLNIWHKIASFF